MSSNPIIPDAKNIAQNEYANNKLPEVLPDNFIRSLTAGNKKCKNLMNGLVGIKCDEHSIDENNNSLVNYPSTVPDIILVQEIIGVINNLEYFTETIKRDLHFFITKWNNGNRNYSHFNISLKEYQQTLGISSKEEARKKINTTLRVLIGCSIVIYNNNKLNYSATNIPIFEHLNYKKNVISIVFSKDFFESLKGINSVIWIHLIIYRLPLTVSLLYLRLMNHKKMRVNQYNENIISVSSLLASCTNLPSEEKANPCLFQKVFLFCW